MVTNKAILGFFVVLIAIVLTIILVRRNPNFIARLRGTSNTPTTEGTPTRTPSATGEVVGQPATEGRTACTTELKAACSSTGSPVCGYEKVVTADDESTRTLTYKSACSYCSLYGTDDVLDLGEEKYYPLGYTPGACSDTK
jgi:hypothetical protein